MMSVHKHAAVKRQYIRRPHSGPVTVSHVSAAAWVTAVTLAGGDRRRLRVIDGSTVLVINRPTTGNSR
jgi:hypothetical protein